MENGLALEGDRQYQIHGFASQAAIYTSDNNFFGETSGTEHFGFTELGINASVKPARNLHMAGQVLLRRAGESDNGRPRLDYGLVDYTLLSEPDRRFGIRVGRILNPMGLYNETRDMAFTRSSIFLPQSIYFDRARDLAISSDGVHLYGEYRRNNNELFWEIGAAEPRTDNDEVEVALLTANFPGELGASNSYLGRLLWERNGGQVRVSLTAVQANLDYRPGGGDPLAAGSIIFEPNVLSVQYNAEDWSVTSEYAQRNFTYQGFGAAIPDMSFTGESYYVQGSYRFAPGWDVFVRRDVAYIDRRDRDGTDWAAAAVGREAHKRFAKEWAAGIGWHIRPEILLRAELHQVDGTAWLPALDNLDPLTQEWNLFALLASYRF